MINYCYISSLKNATFCFDRDLFFSLYSEREYIHFFLSYPFLGILPEHLAGLEPHFFFFFSQCLSTGPKLGKNLALGNAMLSDKWMRMKVLLKHLNRI